MCWPVRDVLGHDSLTSTQVYVKGLDAERLREAMEGRMYRGHVTTSRPGRTRGK
jgi:site-specific recombinase XerD